MHESLISDKRIKLFCPFNNLKTTTTNFSGSNLLCLPQPHFSVPCPVNLLGKPSVLLPALSCLTWTTLFRPSAHDSWRLHLFVQTPSDVCIVKSSNQSLFHLAQLTTPSSWTHCPHVASSPYSLHCWLFLSSSTSSEQPRSRLNLPSFIPSMISFSF